MAAFCVSCGNPLADGAKFCTKCGATQPAAAAPVGTVMPPASTAPAGKGSNTAMKIIIGILAFFMLIILLVAGLGQKELALLGGFWRLSVAPPETQGNPWDE